MAHKVFVYGTLKQNEPNHYWLANPDNGNSSYMGQATTTKKYPLIIATKYNIPFVLKAPGKGHIVKGEVYDIDDKMLSNLDILEDHPNYYIREIDEIQLLDKESMKLKVVKCWIYFLPKFKPELLEYQMFENYTSAGSHGKPYMESQNESTVEDLYDVKLK